jgi:hypothetical protein
MGRSRLYDDFTVSKPFTKLAKQGNAGAKRKYVTICCPHCDNTIAEVTEESLESQKARECLNHLRGDTEADPPVLPCQAAVTAGVVVPKRRRVSAVDAIHEQTEMLKSQHTETMEVLRRQERKMASICEALGLSDHSSDDEDGSKVKERTRRKIDDLKLKSAEGGYVDAFAKVALAARLDSDATKGSPIEVGHRVVQSVKTLSRQAESGLVAQSNIRRINEKLKLASDAKSIETTQAIEKLSQPTPTGPPRYSAISYADQMHSLSHGVGVQKKSKPKLKLGTSEYEHVRVHAKEITMQIHTDKFEADLARVRAGKAGEEEADRIFNRINKAMVANNELVMMLK